MDGALAADAPQRPRAGERRPSGALRTDDVDPNYDIAQQPVESWPLRKLHQAAFASRTLLDLGRPRHLLLFGNALGDDLLCTVPLRELRARGERGLWMMSTHPRLFDGNADVDAVVPWDGRYHALAERLGARISVPHYAAYDFQRDLSVVPERHILALMCQQCGVSGPVTLRPYLHLTETERLKGRLAKRQIAIHSSGLAARWAMVTKEWFPERFQAVVDALGDEYTFVQIGSAKDPPLDGCLDFRGQLSVRESAAVLSQSLLFVGQVGFLMHLARAVETRAVIVYGGRETPAQSGYVCNENVATAPPCGPCWRWRTCDFDRVCMRQIEADQVVEAARRALERGDGPLEAEVVEVPPAVVPRQRSFWTLEESADPNAPPRRLPVRQ